MRATAVPDNSGRYVDHSLGLKALNAVKEITHFLKEFILIASLKDLGHHGSALSHLFIGQINDQIYQIIGR